MLEIPSVCLKLTVIRLALTYAIKHYTLFNPFNLKIVEYNYQNFCLQNFMVFQS
ncbi:hypothetical protein HanXRQr2_Chr05g0215751 [Helianthus annuus]|uniref:Uncharacterized protein n=1 Tax=Helianthus annuus TaxID=4232 RepID=A0A9K3J1F6_HELAN|nr:hypothetical protein HanXRQr2_Chr05g0215751 [Helianthus annuus]KAJ0922822.1 hypothetical protein HanPSC8_Chr05g0208281 [Helianthus annuus]